MNFGVFTVWTSLHIGRCLLRHEQGMLLSAYCGLWICGGSVPIYFPCEVILTVWLLLCSRRNYWLTHLVVFVIFFFRYSCYLIGNNCMVPFMNCFISARTVLVITNILFWDFVYRVVSSGSMMFQNPALFPCMGKEAPNLVDPLD